MATISHKDDSSLPDGINHTSNIDFDNDDHIKDDAPVEENEQIGSSFFQNQEISNSFTVVEENLGNDYL